MINKIFVYWLDKKEGIFENQNLINHIKTEFQLKQSFKIIYDEKGKPYLKGNPHLHISITHTNTDTFFAVSKKNIGIDVEAMENKNHKDDQTIIENYFSESEINYLQKNQTPTCFYRLWTRKEALIKLTSDSLNENILKTNVLPDQIQYQNKQIVFKTIAVEKNLIFSAAMEKNIFYNQIDIIIQKL